MNGLWVTIGGDLRGSARRDRRRDRGSSAGELWRGVAPRSRVQNFQSFQVSRSSYETSGTYGRKEERRELLLRLCNTLDSQVKKILVSWKTSVDFVRSHLFIECSSSKLSVSVITFVFVCCCIHPKEMTDMIN